MDDRRSNISSKGPPPPLIDEGARFYDWRGHALTGEERRARLEAFRAGLQEASPASAELETERAPPSSDAAVTATTLGLPENVMTTDADADADDGDPHVVEGLPSGQRSMARRFFLGLLVAAAALVASAAAGLFDNAPPAGRRGTGQAPPQAALPDIAPASTQAAPSDEMKTPPAPPLPSASSMPWPNAPSGISAEEQPAPAVAASGVPGAQGDQLKSTPSRERATPPTGSTRSPNVVPDDTPKF